MTLMMISRENMMKCTNCMEYKQTYDFYEARRHIQSAMKGDTPIKTGQNRQCKRL